MTPLRAVRAAGAIRREAAKLAMLVIGVMLVAPIRTIGAPGPVRGRATIPALAHKVSPPI